MQRRREAGLLAVISAGGMLGASARYALGRLLPAETGEFPWATYLANLLGSFALGVVAVVVREHYPAGRHASAFVATGLIGAFTTMSSLQVEIVLLAADDHVRTSAVYAAASVVGGLALAAGGVALGRAATSRVHAPYVEPVGERSR